MGGVAWGGPLRDRPTDGAALAHKFYAVIFGESIAGRFLRIFEERCVWLLAKGHAGQSFRLACLTGKNPGV